jgi:ribosomal protein L37AE/L43A
MVGTMTDHKCPFCGEPRIRYRENVSHYACGTVGPDENGKYETGHTCDIHNYSKVFREMDAKLEQLQAINRAYERSGLDISPCMFCGEPVICLPDGMPMCAPCAKKEMGQC